MKIIGDDSIQRTQLTHRIALVEKFNIEKGIDQLQQAPIAIQTLATSFYHLMNRDEANRQSLNSFVLIATQ